MNRLIPLLSAFGIALPSSAFAVEYHDAFRFSGTEARQGFLDTVAVRTRCDSLVIRLEACPLDAFDEGQILWCDFARADGSRDVVPSVAVELPDAVSVAPPACTTPLETGLDGWRVPSYYTSVTVTVGGAAANYGPGKVVAISDLSKFEKVSFVLPNEDFEAGPSASRAPKSLGGAGAFAGEGISSFLRDRAGVEVAMYLAEQVFSRVCAPNPDSPGEIRPAKLLPASCAAHPEWARTGAIDLETLRADMLTLPRHLGEEVLWVDATTPEAKRGQGWADAGVAMAVTGRTMELVFEGSMPTAAIGAWARSRPAVIGGADSTTRLSFAHQPVSSAMYLTSLWIAVLPPVELEVRPDGSFKFRAPVLSNRTVLALLGAAGDTAALPEGTPVLPALSPGSIPLDDLEALVEGIAGEVAGLANAQRSFGTDAIPSSLELLSTTTDRVAALLPVPSSASAGTSLGPQVPPLDDVVDALVAARAGLDPSKVGALVAWAAGLVKTVDPVLEPLQRAVVLGGSALGARSAAEMQAAIEKAAHPPGGYRGKRVPDASPFHWALVNGYVGAGAGGYVTGGTTDTWFVPAALLGPEVGIHTELGPIKSIGLQAVLLDLGNMGAVPLTDVPTTGTFTLRDIATPGLALHLGIGRSPFTVSVPVQYTLGSTPGLRVSGALTVDLVLFP